MKLWSRLCLVVVAAASSARGQAFTGETMKPLDKPGLTFNVTSTSQPLTSKSKNGTTSSNLSRTSPRKVDSSNATVPSETQTWRDVSMATSNDTGGSSVTTETVSMTTTATSVLTGESGGKRGAPWAYVILVLTVVLIIVLCVILYFLRRVSRTHSFDLQRPRQSNHVHLPTFEPLDLHDFEQTAAKLRPITDDAPPALSCSSSSSSPSPSPPPLANGSGRRSEGEGSSDDMKTSLEEQLAANASPPPSNPTEVLPDQWSCTDLFFNADDERQNPNNPSVCSSEPFVDINLDAASW